MNPVVEAFLCSWPFDPWLLTALLLTAGVYLRGWLILNRRDPARWQLSRPAAFLGGLLALFLALASPIETFSFLLLTMHMVQHLLLMMVAPPLLWLGDPLFPMLRGLPAPIRTYWIAPLFRSKAVRSFFGLLTHPVPAWLLYVGTVSLWHVPALYELALRSDGWHYVQHMAFLGTGLLFWYVVVRPYPARPRWSRWLLVPYLILADVQNTVLSALLTFSDRVLYPYYAEMPSLEGMSALDDQATAGVLMWVPGSIAFLVPLFVIGTRALFGDVFAKRQPARLPSMKVGERVGGRISLLMVPVGPAGPHRKTPRADLLRLPILGPFLRWRHARLCLQVPLLIVSGVLLYDGWTGPAVAPMNLAGVLPWIHWRGFLILGLLIVGNVFCMACPFMLPRMLARRVFPQRYSWPRPLRNKWLAVILLGIFLWAYEAFALWDNPWWTAWIIAGYFVAALVIDGFFRGASFCKFVCPIGQFNFVQSLVSPWEVQARDPEICTRCKTKDCIRGRTDGGAHPRRSPAVQGCELHLYVPRKASNMDCTFCLDCVHACPHDNIGIVAGLPAAELWHDRIRSGVGRFGKRPDIAVRVVVLVFGAFANAAGMIAPVVETLDRLRTAWGQQSSLGVVSAYYLFALVLLPLVAVGSTAWLSRWWAGLTVGWREVAVRGVYALVPLGFAMWLSHYSFHLLTSYDAAVPAAQRFLGDITGDLGEPDWTCSCCRPAMPWLLRLEIVFLDVGLLLSLYSGYRIALLGTSSVSQALKALTPAAVLMVLLFALGIWIVLQPMQMRGTLQLAG
jgi:cytochrome c oxidase assembly factor CtaG/ferredoxin